MKTRIIQEVSVRVDPPSERDLMGFWVPQSESEMDRQERYARKLEMWAREFEEFVRDHRSQDPISLFVEREYADVCSHCGRDWEEEKDGQPLCCDQAVKEWEASNAA